MQHKLGLAGLLCLSLSACGDAPQEPLDSRANGLALPTGPHETITVSGKMTFWMYEGDAGCYGSLLTGGQEVELWIDADACGDTEYAENAPASVDITWREDNQWGPVNTYTITRFN